MFKVTLQKIVYWIPVLFVVILIIWIYFSYAIYLCIITITNPIEKIIYLVVFHIMLFITCVSYARTIVTPLPIIPPEYYLTISELDQSEKSIEALTEIIDTKGKKLQIQTRTDKGTFRYCKVCKLVKPDRCHHCSICRCCVLRMDHHCPWMHNCVMLTNHKYFYLFLVYALITCLFVMATSFQYCINFFRYDMEKNPVKMSNIINVVDLIFMFALFLFFLIFSGYQTKLIFSNKTTIESMKSPIFRSGPDDRAFDRGCLPNVEDIFGKQKWKWFFPVASKLDCGVKFPTRISSVNNYQAINSSSPPKIDIAPVQIQPPSERIRSMSRTQNYVTIPMDETKT